MALTTCSSHQLLRLLGRHMPAVNLSSWGQQVTSQPFSSHAPDSQGAGGGPPTRSVQQAHSDTHGGPARSPDAPADPVEHIHSHGSAPTEALRHASGKAHEALSDAYDHPEQNIGPSYIKAAPEMAGRFMEKVGGAAGRAAEVAGTVVNVVTGRYDGTTLLQGQSPEGEAAAERGDAVVKDEAGQVVHAGREYQEAAHRVSDIESTTRHDT